MPQTENAWDSYSRVHASQQWRRQSGVMGSHFTQAIVAEARVEPGMHVLDVASGTGEPAISLASLLQGSGRVVATDISPEPLKVGQQRAQQRKLSNIEFLRADVHALPFPDASFHRVTCRLGIMFFADVPRALREMCRVLKPGGRASLLAWGPMQQPYFATTIGTILRAVPTAILPASGASMFKFGELGTFTGALFGAGFGQVEERLQDLPWNWPGTPEEVWQYFQEVTVPFKPLFQAIPLEQREAVNAKVIEAIRRYYRDGEVRFTATAALASAHL